MAFFMLSIFVNRTEFLNLPRINYIYYIKWLVSKFLKILIKTHPTLLDSAPA